MTPNGSSRAQALGLAGLFLLALAVRALPFPLVFPGGGEVVFEIGDAWYHVRRAFWGMLHFPAVLLHDPLLNHPVGAKVPFPPLWAFLLAGVGRAFGGSTAALERAAAWLPPLLGALALLPTARAARIFGSGGTALGAAAILALMPVSVRYSQVGNADHHAMVALLGALFLLFLLQACQPDLPPARLRATFLGLAAARLALLLTWNGSLLYLALGDVTLLVILVARGERASLWAAALSAGATALATAPWVALLGVPNGGPWAAVELSRLHVALLAGEAVVAGGTAALDTRWPTRSAALRVGRAALLAGACAVALLALPGARAGLVLAVTWMGQEGFWGELNAEQLPLLGLARASPHSQLSAFAWLLPLAPVAALLEARRRPLLRGPALLLAVWTAVLGALTLDQRRYGNELAPGAALAFALGLGRLAAGLQGAARLPAASAPALAVLMGALLLAPGIYDVHWPRARGLLRLWQGSDADVDLGLAHPTGSLARFARLVRATTPDDGAFAEGGGVDQGVLSHPNLGHVMHYAARRATPADNFGPWLADGTGFARTLRFLGTQREEEAYSLARALRTPWIVTFSYGQADPHAVATRLHENDGRAGAGHPALSRFRLATEGPAGGVPLGVLFGLSAPDGPPYKLFEVVEGARLEVPALPGSPVAAAITVQTPLGRRFVHRIEVHADAAGIGRLRLPYATETELPTRPVSPWRITAGEMTWTLRLEDAAVREGRNVRLRPLPDST